MILQVESAGHSVGLTLIQNKRIVVAVFNCFRDIIELKIIIVAISPFLPVALINVQSHVNRNGFGWCESVRECSKIRSATCCEPESITRTE
jgi:hypothetical protein